MMWYIMVRFFDYFLSIFNESTYLKLDRKKRNVLLLSDLSEIIDISEFGIKLMKPCRHLPFWPNFGQFLSVKNYKF